MPAHHQARSAHPPLHPLPPAPPAPHRLPACLQGRNVVIEQAYGGPKITKDGVTVAKAIEFKDRFQNVGASLVKAVASATNDVAGDGTTTATVLTRAILVEGCKSVAAGMNPMDLRRGINLAVEHVVGELKARAKMISTTEEIAQVGGGARVGAVWEGGMFGGTCVGNCVFCAVHGAVWSGRYRRRRRGAAQAAGTQAADQHFPAPCSACPACSFSHRWAPSLPTGSARLASSLRAPWRRCARLALRCCGGQPLV